MDIRLATITCLVLAFLGQTGCGKFVEQPAVAAPAEATGASSPAASCELKLSLPMSIGKTEYKVAHIEIKNTGRAPVTLVQPGDGSNCKLRTPTVGWSLLEDKSDARHPDTPTPSGGARCGNVNSLKRDEVFTLAPGETKVLSQWVSFPGHSVKPGKYRVVFYYANVPDLKWSGLPLGKHDETAMTLIKASTAVSLKSNEVFVEVTE